ncbi:tripartite tricarboxylate transporter substrate binding protein [Aquamicrobium sp. LC103]|uniref:Bug family tripartite tricarboxylate transporter substrate binding protein n=1 Tax=Aquamicrobium sp. LC103 TaxID=1120658 RepID=UPI00063EC4AF|nr:tripartite tricarboxylate transporter substrate binding protein [Aquamicrobium sp. LC103]
MRHFSYTLLAAFCFVTGAFAGDYPEREIRWVVPFGAGSVTDLTARKLAEVLGQKLNQPVIIENKPGAGGVVGTKEVAIAKADGYTILYGSSGPLGILPALDPSKLSYDPVDGFDHIQGITRSSQIIVARPDAPFNTISELVEYAKENPGKLNFGSPGVGTAQHLAGEVLKSATGTDIVHVPYTTGTNQMVDLAAGVIDLSFEYAAVVKPYVEDGKMKVLGTTSTERAPAFPDAQTVVEAGHPNAVNFGWTIASLPKGAPDEVKAKLEKAFQETLHDEGIQAFFAADSREALSDVNLSNAQEFVRSEIDKFSKVSASVKQ